MVAAVSSFVCLVLFPIFELVFFAQVIANETKEMVTKEEQEASKKAEETQEIADDAQKDLNEALPALV